MPQRDRSPTLAPVDSVAEIAGALRDVQHRAYRVEAERIGDDRIPALHETIDDLCRAPLSWVVARVDDTVVGAVAWTIDGDTLDIDRLVVDPRVHRRGIGRRLVDAAIHAAGPRAIVVSTALANTPALALYRAAGFEQVGTREVLDGLWIALLRRPVTPG